MYAAEPQISALFRNTLPGIFAATAHGPYHHVRLTVSPMRLDILTHFSMCWYYDSSSSCSLHHIGTELISTEISTNAYNEEE